MIPEYLERLRMERRLSKQTLELYAIELRTLERLGRDLDSIRRHLSRCASATHARKLIIWKAYLASINDPWLDSLASPRVRSKAVSFLNENEEIKLRAEVSEVGLEEALFVDLALVLGLRISEILQITSKNLEGDWLKITRKGDKEQYVPLTENLKLRLEGFLGFKNGRRYFQVLIKALSKRAGITKRVTPHTLRHTFASRAIRNGCNVILLRDILGHNSLSTTNKYCHSTPQHMMNMIRGIK